MAARRRGRAHAKAVDSFDIQVGDIPIRVTRKYMKSINMRIKPTGQVVMSAPAALSKEDIMTFALARQAWLEEQLERTADSPMVQAESATKEEKDAWKELIRLSVPYLVEQWAPVMGVEPKTLVYRDMRSRWGSCQPATGRICINIRLALYPAQCLEYVVVHELCHLLEPGHGPRFHALMSKYLPDWKERRRMLK